MKQSWFVLFALCGSLCASGVHAQETLLLRAESLTVLPRSQPVLHVRVANSGGETFAGQIAVQVPASWRLATASQDVQLGAGEEKRLTFSLVEGSEDAGNRYPVEITARGGGQPVVRRQEIVVASAPSLNRPSMATQVTGRMRFRSLGSSLKKTSIATYWNRREFSMLVTVEESKYVPLGESPLFDAVQVALAAQGTQTSRSPDGQTNRFEYLIFGDQEGKGHCCLLTQPGQKLADVCQPRPLPSLRYDEAKVAVRRDGSLTHYEFSLPLTIVREQIRPSEGREFYLSVLVHDPDGTGLRDWGQAAGLWETQRHRLAWSGWEGAQWGDQPPMDCRVEWGMCSSKY